MVVTDKAKFYVASSGEFPDKILFSRDAAIQSKFNYLDAFDENGELIERYGLVDGEYSTDF